MQKRSAAKSRRLILFIIISVVIIVGLMATIIAVARNNADKRKIHAIATLSPSLTPDLVAATTDPASVPDDEQDFAPPADFTTDGGTISINIKAIGDIAMQTDILAGAYDSSTASYDFTRLFSKISEHLQSDFTIASFESVCVDTSLASYSGEGTYNTPTSAIDALKAAGVDAVTLANSHILDHGLEGIKFTTAKLNQVGLMHFGAYNSQDEADLERISLVDVKGIKIALLSYTEDVRGNLSSLTTAQQQFAVNIAKKETIVSDIGRAREKGADVVIVALHWGKLFTNEPSSDMRSLAEDCLNAGADIILGSHTQEVQRITNKMVTRGSSGESRGIVAYCLGNFVSEYRENLRDSGIILSIDIEKDTETGEVTISTPSYMPTWIDKISESGTYVFEVVRISDYYDSAGSMTSASHTRMKAAWGEITGIISADSATLVR